MKMMIDIKVLMMIGIVIMKKKERWDEDWKYIKDRNKGNERNNER